jgi:hypothetical protein
MTRLVGEERLDALVVEYDFPQHVAGAVRLQSLSSYSDEDTILFVRGAALSRVEEG